MLLAHRQSLNHLQNTKNTQQKGESTGFFFENCAFAFFIFL